MEEIIIQKVRFDEKGLIPAIVQDADTNEVLALCRMDSTSLAKTLQSGITCFAEVRQSGSRCTAGKDSLRHPLVDVRVSGEGDLLTVLVHTGGGGLGSEKPASLLRDLGEANTAKGVSLADVGAVEFGLALDSLYRLIAERKEKRPEGSYTTYLFNSGLDKILKKIAEETGEVIIASKNKAPREVISELTDLFYHLLVLMVERDVKLSDVHSELSRRAHMSSKLSENGSTLHGDQG